MVSGWVALLLVGPLIVEGSRGGPTATPVFKVVEMLQKMVQTAQTEKNAEEVEFATFSTWCSEEQARLTREIASDKEEIETLTAEAGKLESDAKVLGGEITQLNADITGYTADKKSQTLQRAKDRSEFEATSRDYSESIDALDRAIMVLQKQSFDRPALLQLSQNKALPMQAASMVAAFLGMAGDDDTAPPEANAYEFQSGGVIDLLKRLKDEFREKKGQSAKEEMNSQQAFDMVEQDLTASIETATRSVEEKSASKEHKTEKASVNRAQAADTAACMAEDENILSQMTTECTEKTHSFEEKQQLRAEEMEAIQQAIKILSSEDVKGNAVKHLALSQVPAFIQIASAAASEPSWRARKYLEDASHQLHSSKLGLLAASIAADDPFAKVKKLIDNMITRLLDEANADAEKEGWCDKELGTNKNTRERLEEQVDGLSAEVQGGHALQAELAKDIATLTQEVAEVEAAMTKATELRMSEKKVNAATVADAQDAKTAVEAATAILKEFYSGALQATALLQTSASPRASLLREGGVKMGSEEWNSLANPDFKGKIDPGHKAGMQTFGDAYSGMQGEAGGVLAILEVIHSDFATLQADTEAAEASSQQAFVDFMRESKKSKAVKERSINLNTADKASAKQRLGENIADMKSLQDQLLAANRYHEELIPQCIDQGQTFAQRAAARQAEIQSLKTALTILSNEDIATSSL